MMTDNNRNYVQDDTNFEEENKSHVDQYQRENIKEHIKPQKANFLIQNKNNCDSDNLFTNGLNEDELDQEYDIDQDLEEKDPVNHPREF